MLKGPFLPRNWLGSVDDYCDSQIVMVGLPFDGTCSYRPGSRFAPERLRPASWGLEDYSPIFNKHLDEARFFDAGELEFPLGNTKASLDLIEENARQVYLDGKKFLGIGGEHLVTYPAVKACLEKYPDLKIVHFDAHTDLREDYLGEKLSHASVMRRIGEMTGFHNIRQIGIRSGLKEEFDLMKEYGTLIHSGGLTYCELNNWLQYLKNFDIAGADVVELAPDYDSSGVSTAVTTKVIRDVLMIM